jgi:hypothetical protein
MLYHGESVLPYGYGADDVAKMTAEQQAALYQAGITGGSEIVGALITAFGAQSLAKQQQTFTLSQQRQQYAQERALARMGGGGVYVPTSASVPAPAPSGGIDTTTLLLILGVGAVLYFATKSK